jgi:hypothetical protein
MMGLGSTVRQVSGFSVLSLVALAELFVKRSLSFSGFENATAVSEAKEEALSPNTVAGLLKRSQIEEAIYDKFCRNSCATF